MKTKASRKKSASFNAAMKKVDRIISTANASKFTAKSRGNKIAAIASLIPDQSQIDWKLETQRLISRVHETGAKLVYIDLFCGFGGTTAGVAKARNKYNESFAIVGLGINHDDIALACHKIHNPYTLHLREDIRKVVLDPIGKMFDDLRAACPWVKVVIWTSAECTHHSRAKGGDSRDPDSRSMAEEIYRYEEVIKPDLIQVENVNEFRSWGPLMQKIMDLSKIDLREFKHKLIDSEFGPLFSKNKKVWIDKKTGLAYKKVKNKDKGVKPDTTIAAWMIPIPERKAEYFNEWKNELKSRGYKYDDRDINAADHGAFTSRIRYYGQFAKGMPIVWPQQTHAKDPDKHFLKFGFKLLKHNAVREVLDFADTGDSIFVPGRITSNQTFKRLTEGAIKHIAGGKEKFDAYCHIYEHWLATGELNFDLDQTDKNGQFLIKYNSHNPAAGDFKHSVVDTTGPAPTIPCRNMFGKPHFDFMVKYFGCNQGNMNFSVDGPCSSLTTKDRVGKAHVDFMVKHFGGDPKDKSYSINGPAHTITNIDHNAKVHTQFLPFILQYNKGYDLHEVDKPIGPQTTQPHFYATNFIQQRTTGTPSSKVIGTNGPARTVTSTGGNQDLVQVEKILPYMYSDAVDSTQQPFIFRQFSEGQTSRSIDEAAGGLPTVPKMNLISAEWIMDAQYKNVGHGVDQPCKTITADRHHAYLVSHSFNNPATSVDKPSPVVIERQDKKPLHLAQVQYGDTCYYGIVVYENDSAEIKELKYFMAAYGIIDIKMRMLKEIELLPIQGFPADYIEKVREAGIKVTTTNAKKYIGNSQEVTTAKAIVESYAPYFDNLNLKSA